MWKSFWKQLKYWEETLQAQPNGNLKEHLKIMNYQHCKHAIQGSHQVKTISRAKSKPNCICAGTTFHMCIQVWLAGHLWNKKLGYRFQTPHWDSPYHQLSSGCAQKHQVQGPCGDISQTRAHYSIQGNENRDWCCKKCFSWKDEIHGRNL